jgi:hypothetical protein
MFRTLAVQYLEPGPPVGALAVGEVRAKLRAALDRTQDHDQRLITDVLIGWQLPDALVRVCREEATRAGARLFLWHPLLTGDGVLIPVPEWQAIGLGGQPVPGFRSMPEFTFVCPNRSAVRDAVLHHLREVCVKDVRDVMRQDDRGAQGTQSRLYDGVFLDRIRYPSPAPDPARWLACFCKSCRRAASDMGLDLVDIRRKIRGVLERPEGQRRFVQALLDLERGQDRHIPTGARGSGPQVSGQDGHVPSSSEMSEDPALEALDTFLDFRAQSVTKLLYEAIHLIHEEGLAVGLDCFSPALTKMVGQDLEALDSALDPEHDWVKVMTYGHALGPATLPFELLNLADWLVKDAGMAESEALSHLAEATGLPLPEDRARLRERGLPSEALVTEVHRAREMGLRRLLAGVELVEIEDVAELDDAQIEADLRALRDAPLDGLVLSWDLWHMPPERLTLVQRVYEETV